MSKKEASDVVVLEQDLLNIPECFVYRIPPMRSAEGHRAEDWNLPTPLATCALQIVRRDNSLLLKLLSSRPKKNGPTGSTEKYSFAQSTVTFLTETNSNTDDNIEKTDHPNFSQQLEHSITNVVDSSRYFVVRIQNEKTNREAQVGVGFRERDDATNLKMACMEFVKIMNREYKALHHSNATTEQEKGSSSAGVNDLAASINTKLSFKEGEKIHVHIPIKTNANQELIDEQHQHKQQKSVDKKKNPLIGKGGLFLKKPPPPPSPSTSSDDKKNSDDDEKNAQEDEKDQKEEEVDNVFGDDNTENARSVELRPQSTRLEDANDDITSDDATSNDDIEKVDDDNDHDDNTKEESKQVATSNVDDDDDDEWGDFESGGNE